MVLLANRYLRVMVWALFILMVLAHLPFLTVRAPLDYDEGVYWQTITWILKGKALYTEVFCSQLPLFIRLMAWSGRVTTESISTYRTTILVLSLPLIPLLGFGGMRLKSRDAGVFAVLSALLSVPLFFRSHVLQGNVPALTFAVAALLLGIRSARHEKGLISATISGAVFAVSVNIKALAAPALLPVILAFLSGPKEFHFISRRLGLFLISFAIVASLIMVTLGWNSYEALSQLNGGATLHPVPSNVLSYIPDRAAKIFSLLSTDSRDNIPFVLGVLLCVIVFEFPKSLLIPLGWIMSFLVTFFVYNKFNSHYMVMLIPGSTLVGAIGFGTFFDKVRMGALGRTRTGLGSALIFTACLFNFYFSLSVRADVLAGVARSRQEIEILVPEMRDKVPTGGLVLSDDQFIPALAGFQVPAHFVDTSFARIQENSLTCDLLKIGLQDPSTQAVLYISKRFQSLSCDKEILSLYGNDQTQTEVKLGSLLIRRSTTVETPLR